VAWGTISVSDEPAGYDQAVWFGGGVRSSPVWLRCTAPDALSNLVAVLELAADRQLRYGAATRRPLAATVRLVEDVLVAGDYYEAALAGTREPIAIAAFAWPLLVQAGGLAQLAGARLELTARGRAALAQPSYQTLGALWDRWLTSVSRDELARVESIKGQRRPSTLTSVPGRRAAVAAGLTAVEPGAWTDVDVLLRVMATQPRPLVVARSLRALWRLYLTDSYHGSLGHAGSAAGNVLAARYALCVLFEYAATMGVIDVAYTGPAGARDDYRGLWGTGDLAWLSRYDGLVAVRVNELGAAILHDPGALSGLSLPVPRRPAGQSAGQPVSQPVSQSAGQ
jgi:hypothetical protein